MIITEAISKDSYLVQDDAFVKLIKMFSFKKLWLKQFYRSQLSLIECNWIDGKINNYFNFWSGIAYLQEISLTYNRSNWIFYNHSQH